MNYIDGNAPVDFEPINHNFEECDSILLKKITEYNTQIYGTIGTPKWDVYPITSEVKEIGSLYRNQYVICSTDINIPQNVIGVNTKSTQRVTDTDYTDGIFVSPLLQVRYTRSSLTLDVPLEVINVNVSWRSTLKSSNLQHTGVFPTVFVSTSSTTDAAKIFNIVLASHASYGSSQIQGILHIEFLGRVLDDE